MLLTRMSPLHLGRPRWFRGPPVSMQAGTPEAIGKADYLQTLITTISSGLGATVGLAQMVARAINVRARRLEALHDVRFLGCCSLHFLKAWVQS